MASTLKRKAAPDEFEGTTYEIEDAILRRIYLVTLNIDDIESDSRVLYLETTAAEMLSEGKDLKLCKESMERVLIDRLSGQFAAAVEAVEPPFQYLRNCFRRACEEEMKDVIRTEEIAIMTVKHAKDLAVSYCRIFLGNPGVLPNWDSCNNSKTSPLFPLLFSEVFYPGASNRPPGFISKLFNEGDYDSLEPIFTQLYEDLRDRVVKVSVLGDFQELFWVFHGLIEFPVGAKVLVDQLNGFSNLNGREIAMKSILGAFFHISPLPDVGQEASAADIMSSSSSIIESVNMLQNWLAKALTCLLINTGNPENVLQYIAELINKNASRAHIQFHPLSCASSGTFVNLSAVMLLVFEALLDGNWTKSDEIDPRYVFDSSRLELRGLTALHATSDQISGWSESGNMNQKFPLTCECFFMTARVLNLGLVKTFSHIRHLVETVATDEITLSSWKAEQDKSPSPSLQRKIAHLEEIIELHSQELSCYETQVQDNKGLLLRALSFYRLMVVWMVDLAGGFKIPAPATCPEHFAAIPEHFVDDAMEFLMFFITEVEALDRIELADFMNFIVMFMCSPQFIQNPHLRTKMVEVLNCLILNGSANKLLKGHQPAMDHLVWNLLQVYADTESTGSRSEKFDIRHDISKLLKHLWEVPSHRNAWRRIAKEEEKGVYLQFLNFLTTDSISLLDEGLSKIMRMAEPEPPSWIRRTVKLNMVHANADIDMICFTSEEIVAPFLLPEMVGRVASMLNYFLSRLVTMFERNHRALQFSELQFRPKELLTQIIKIYVNLARGDEENVFVAAIAKDGQSYSEELFGAAAEELKKNGDEEAMIREFLELGRKAKAATKQAEEAELALGEIPEEFMDPIMSTLMTDPVILPTTNVRIDRPVILRHLLSKSTDPFSGLPLTADMLIPDSELKAKIDRFLQN